MTSTLQDSVILFGLFIDGRSITSISVHNRIVLCGRSFGLASFLSELKGILYVLSALRRYSRHHQMIVMKRAYKGTKSISFNLYVGMPKHIYSIFLGNVLFIDLIKRHVPLPYLTLQENFDVIPI